jgi:hypothetical protein
VGKCRCVLSLVTVPASIGKSKLVLSESEFGYTLDVRNFY